MRNGRISFHATRWQHSQEKLAVNKIKSSGQLTARQQGAAHRGQK